MFYNTFQICSPEEGRMKQMDHMKWKKIIIKDKFQTENGTVHSIQRIYIALCNTETGEYLISPFSDFLNEFAGRKPVTVSLAADIITRFLNYAIFHKNRTIDTLTIQDGIDYLNSITETAQKKTQSEYAHYLTRFYAFLDKKEALKAVSPEELEYSTDQEGHRVLENPFTGRFIEGERKDAELIHNIEPEYLYTFIKTAMDEVPDIALGVFLQCFGGLRKSEVISLEYKNISITTVGDKRAMQLTLKDKDLREDVSTAFLAHCKRNRIQTVLPAYDGLLWELFDKHKKRFKKEGCSAVFVDADGRAMTDAVYYKRFSILKERFIERLRNSDDFDAKSYAVYLSTYKWSTHLCRGIFSNLIAQGTDNIMEIAAWRGDKNLSSALSYLTDRKQMDENALRILNELYKEEIG